MCWIARHDRYRHVLHPVASTPRSSTSNARSIAACRSTASLAWPQHRSRRATRIQPPSRPSATSCRSRRSPSTWPRICASRLRLDLPIALAVLVAEGVISEQRSGRLVLGELGLDVRCARCAGAGRGMRARRRMRGLLVPEACAEEAASSRARRASVADIAEVVAALRGEHRCASQGQSPARAARRSVDMRRSRQSLGAPPSRSRSPATTSCSRPTAPARPCSPAGSRRCCPR